MQTDGTGEDDLYMRLKDLKRQMEFLDIQAQIVRVGNEKGLGLGAGNGQIQHDPIHSKSQYDTWSHPLNSVEAM